MIGVSLRPKDPFAKKIVSTGVESRNLLIKVTLPKRTGRKRKRGTNDPFTEPASPAPPNDSITAPEFLQRLHETAGKHTISPVGPINETHRFRHLPDFQMIASENAMMRELAAHAFKPNYETLKNLKIDMTPGAAHIESWVAPPSFMAATHPYRYEFNQAAGVKFEQDSSGKVTTTNIQAPPRRVALAVEPDIDEVPQGPPPNLKRHHSFGTYLDEAVKALRQLLERRPLITRRVAMNFIPQYSDTVFKEATQWVGYSFRAGPWRDSLVKYGVDPRKDPEYRKYQTLMFQVDKRIEKAAGPDRPAPEGWQNHIFDGENLTRSGKTWQICDVTDPLLRSILDTTSIQEECDVHQFGWYYNGTLCKARAIMRDKIDFLLRGLEQPQAEYEKIAKLPERVTREKLAETYLADAEVGSKAGELAIEVRSMARLGEKSAQARAKERRLKESLGTSGRNGGLEDGMEGEEDEDEDDAGAGALDPALAGKASVDETLQGDFEADDEDDDAGADLEAVGDLEDDQEAEEDEDDDDDDDDDEEEEEDDGQQQHDD